MRILNQDLWSAKADLVVVTCNGYVKDGRLVMGRGAAKEAADRYPTLQKRAGERLLFGQFSKYRDCFVYGFTPLLSAVGDKEIHIRRIVVGLLQVKYHFRDKAELPLIGYSIVKMNNWLENIDRVWGKGDIKSIAMNFPGIGYGGLRREEVEPLLRDLDDRVTIYVKE